MSNQKNSTALVANVIHKIPNPQNNNWMREKKKQKEQPPTSLLCKPGITKLKGKGRLTTGYLLACNTLRQLHILWIFL
jgi:hypothetical protein